MAPCLPDSSARRCTSSADRYTRRLVVLRGRFSMPFGRVNREPSSFRRVRQDTRQDSVRPQHRRGAAAVADQGADLRLNPEHVHVGNTDRTPPRRDVDPPRRLQHPVVRRCGRLSFVIEPVGRQLADSRPPERRSDVLALELGHLDGGRERLRIAFGRESAALRFAPVRRVIADAVKRCAACGLVSANPCRRAPLSSLP